MIPAAADVAIRAATDADANGLGRLAVLDCAAVPEAPLLLAEVDGGVRAALSLSSGATIADPFHRTAELVALMRLRAAQLPGHDRDRDRGERPHRPRLGRLVPRLA